MVQEGMQLVGRAVDNCSGSMGSDCNVVGKCQVLVSNIELGVKEM